MSIDSLPTASPPEWYHPADLPYISASTSPKDIPPSLQDQTADQPGTITPASIVSFLKTHAVSIDRIPGGKPRCSVRVPSGSTAIIPSLYRLPLVYFSHFLWTSIWLVIVKKLPWEDHMYNILHVARLLDAFAEEAIANTSAYRVGTSPANGGAGATTTRATSREWRCAAFDRAAIRMSCNGYLLPRDGYGDRYMSEFWAEHQDLRYKQDISECK